MSQGVNRNTLVVHNTRAHGKLITDLIKGAARRPLADKGCPRARGPLSTRRRPNEALSQSIYKAIGQVTRYRDDGPSPETIGGRGLPAPWLDRMRPSYYLYNKQIHFSINETSILHSNVFNETA
ncbi:hypothetical protein EVAR_51037_1 [Eumeta japonica]|uniref:Uncharacterized protein n=1 Tax=Eumeta variegata TaxID=151549 RepID=A0A4C1Y4B1_EUMVA|nr:hypothetical protein EVAR_51037_1 [Eumeta japonica]